MPSEQQKTADTRPSLWNRNFSLVFAANFLMGFSFHIFGSTLPLHLTIDLHAGKDEAGLVLAVYVIAALICRPFSGFLADSFSRKNLYVLSFALFTAFAASYFWASDTHIFLILRLLHGFAWGLVSTAGSTLAIDLAPSERRGESIGYYGVSSNIAMAVGPMTGLFLFEHLSFKAVLPVSVTSCSLGLILAFLIKAQKREPVKNDVISLDRFLFLDGIKPGLTMTAVAIAYGAMMSFMAIFGKENGMHSTGFFFAILAVGFILSRVISGKFYDKGYSRGIGSIGAISAGVVLAFVALFPNPVVYFSGAFLLGIAFGANVPAVQNIIVGSAPNSKRGSANSTYLTSFDIGMGIGMFGSGVVSQTAGISSAFLIGAAFSVFGGFALWQVAKPRGSRVES